MDPTLLNLVYQVPPGSPPYQLAVTLCMIRGLDPHSYNGGTIQNWQTVIAEALVLQQIERMLHGN